MSKVSVKERREKIVDYLKTSGNHIKEFSGFGNRMKPSAHFVTSDHTYVDGDSPEIKYSDFKWLFFKKDLIVLCGREWSSSFYKLREVK